MERAIVTLLSDLGARDASVAAVKAALANVVEGIIVEDMSHEIRQYDLRQGAYVLSAAAGHYPAGTIHLVMVDVFGGDAPAIALVERGGHYFIAPDNGILPLAFQGETIKAGVRVEVERPCFFIEWVRKAVDLILKLKSGGFSQDYFDLQSPVMLQPKLLPDGVECNILYIDRFENVVLDITKPEFEEVIGDKPMSIRILRADDIKCISVNYNDVDEGKPLARFNAAGYLEIAVNRGGAATLLGLGGERVENLRYRTIKVFTR